MIKLANYYQKMSMNEYNSKNQVRIKINGQIIERTFPNEGKARQYLADHGYTKEDIRKGIVKIIK